MSAPKQIIVMRTDLGMRKGKMIAQGAHASMKFISQWLQDPDATPPLSPVEWEWLEGLFTKICVGVDSEKELVNIYTAARFAGVKASIIRDAGKTEFAGVPTLTCAAIGPDYPERIDPITSHLRLL